MAAPIPQSSWKAPKPLCAIGLSLALSLFLLPGCASFEVREAVESQQAIVDREFSEYKLALDQGLGSEVVAGELAEYQAALLVLGQLEKRKASEEKSAWARGLDMLGAAAERVSPLAAIFFPPAVAIAGLVGRSARSVSRVIRESDGVEVAVKKKGSNEPS